MRPLILIFLTALLLRAAAASLFPVYPLIDNTADTAVYDEGARSLARGDGYTWGGRLTAFFPIGWPLALSLAYRAAGVSPAAGQALNVLASLLLLLAEGFVANHLKGFVQGLVIVAAIVFESGKDIIRGRVREVIWLDKILAPHLHRIQVQFPRD